MRNIAVSRLVGSPLQDTLDLIRTINRENPVTNLLQILLDEIEKLIRMWLNILLQVLDDGHLTDSKGRKVDFWEILIFIMTFKPWGQRLFEMKAVWFPKPHNMTILQWKRIREG